MRAYLMQNLRLIQKHHLQLPGSSQRMSHHNEIAPTHVSLLVNTPPITGPTPLAMAQTTEVRP